MLQVPHLSRGVCGGLLEGKIVQERNAGCEETGHRGGPKAGGPKAVAQDSLASQDNEVGWGLLTQDPL